MRVMAHWVDANRCPSGLNASAMVDRGDGSSSQWYGEHRLKETVSAQRSRAACSALGEAATVRPAVAVRYGGLWPPPASSRSRRIGRMPSTLWHKLTRISLVWGRPAQKVSPGGLGEGGGDSEA